MTPFSLIGDGGRASQPVVTERNALIITAALALGGLAAWRLC